ncbi:hypothetical protein AN478_13040 [Thiohalorhabdus denitrificans]|uniref:Uncharacterized protein n=1 Tax=Thiohalorhabdus denitrificans TaxID=381306 RepID=A0A0P9C7J8_9GAMM|nr:hypothetical protein [Thiohalorhabdus denitrificans]KPV39195.1 hypothetical protein AN478_13040 [Thiohalorhabdus denitrificans]SCX75464.1 hypothetical protein SAMN05661077_0242 [Thiohalorhabdus denitrificans]
MRTIFAFLVSPLAGVTVFFMVWLASGLAMNWTDGGGSSLAPEDPVPAWALGAYPVVLLLSVPLFLEIRAAIGWTFWSLFVAAVAVYPSVLLLLGYAGVEFHSLMRGWPDWLGVVVAALVHAELFLGIIHSREKRYFYR